MKLHRTLLVACAALVVLPAVASAQSSVPPPGGDNLADAIPVRPSNSSFLPLTPGVLGFSADTTNYTTEAGEFDVCGNSTYGKTIWSLFAVDRTGRIDITAAGYDSVLALLPLNNAGVPQSGPCTDRLAGRIESFPRDNLPIVEKGNVYAVQVGGFRGADGNFAGGPLEVDFELLPPERVEGDAILTWRSARGGIRVTSVRVSGPRGGAAGIQCVRRRCGRQQIIRNTSPKAFSDPIAKIDPAARPKPAGGKLVPAAKQKDTVRYASSTAFRGRRVPNGARLVVIVLAPGQIGQAFTWDIKNNAAGAKTLGCVEPDGSRIQRRGTCDGR
jgi:hypothetical protein